MKGTGAACEAHLIRQGLYNAHYHNTKFRLASFGALDIETIPADLQSYRFFNTENDTDVQGLIKWLQTANEEQEGFSDEAPELPWPFADHFDLRDLCASFLVRDSSLKYVLARGESECGKTSITKHLITLTDEKSFDWLRVGRIDFKGQPEVSEEFKRCALLMGLEATPDPNASLKEQLEEMIELIARKPQPTLLIFDTYEKISHSELGNWLEETLLLISHRVYPWLRILIAGKEIPDPTDKLWRNQASTIQLKPPGEDDWVEYAARSPKTPNPEAIREVFRLTDGKPSALFAVIGEVS